MNHFLATRLAAPLALVGIVVSAIAIAHAGSTNDIIVNSLFLFSSLMEFVAAAALWYLHYFLNFLFNFN